jgi:hypothetical protein
LKRLAVLIFSLIFVLILVYCGGSSSSTPPVSMLQHRAFISNAYSGQLQIMDTQNDTTAYTAQQVNSAGQVIPGVPVTISVGNSTTWEALSSDRSKTMVYDPSDNNVFFITNSSGSILTSVVLGGAATTGLFSADGNSAYVPVSTVPVSGSRAGGIQVVSVTNSNISATWPVPSASRAALSPSGQYLLVFANNSDSVFLIDTTATTPTAVEVPGFSRPVNAFFSGDSNTAYILNCGWECGDPSPGQASVVQFNLPNKTIQATVPVGGASVGLMSGTTLYVAGTSFTAGPTFDSVNVSNMTRNTANSVAINPGLHTTMALSMNNKLYIGAVTCSSSTVGCLSAVNVTTNTASTPTPPNCQIFGGTTCTGPITGMLAISGRNVIYVIDGGYQIIYDTTSDTLQQTQVIFNGALYSLVQVDQ